MSVGVEGFAHALRRVWFTMDNEYDPREAMWDLVGSLPSEDDHKMLEEILDNFVTIMTKIKE